MLKYPKDLAGAKFMSHAAADLAGAALSPDITQTSYHRLQYAKTGFADWQLTLLLCPPSVPQQSPAAHIKILLKHDIC